MQDVNNFFDNNNKKTKHTTTMVVFSRLGFSPKIPMSLCIDGVLCFYGLSTFILNDAHVS